MWFYKVLDENVYTAACMEPQTGHALTCDILLSGPTGYLPLVHLETGRSWWSGHAILNQDEATYRVALQTPLTCRDACLGRAKAAGLIGP